MALGENPAEAEWKLENNAALEGFTRVVTWAL